MGGKRSPEDNRKQDLTRTCALEHCSRCPYISSGDKSFGRYARSESGRSFNIFSIFRNERCIRFAKPWLRRSESPGPSNTLTYYAFPDLPWQKIRTNNPLERLSRCEFVFAMRILRLCARRCRSLSIPTKYPAICTQKIAARRQGRRAHPRRIKTFADSLDKTLKAGLVQQPSAACHSKRALAKASPPSSRADRLGPRVRVALPSQKVAQISMIQRNRAARTSSTGCL